ncbi:hypothetical protein B0H10DRAFT_1941273 [Mycena sp. CBHHK59/15]|nr:hypothetical protein B0H10DRAFT_1941273 [Mycena sp. CBHHK59/15]
MCRENWLEKHICQQILLFLPHISPPCQLSPHTQWSPIPLAFGFLVVDSDSATTRNMVDVSSTAVTGAAVSGPGECWTCGSWVGQKQRFEARNCSIIVKNNEPYHKRTPDAAQRDGLRRTASTFGMTHWIVGSGVALSLATRDRGGGAVIVKDCRTATVAGWPQHLPRTTVGIRDHLEYCQWMGLPIIHPVLPPQSSWVKYFGDWGKQHMRAGLPSNTEKTPNWAQIFVRGCSEKITRYHALQISSLNRLVHVPKESAEN